MSLAAGRDARWPGTSVAVDSTVLEDFLATTALFSRCDRTIVVKVVPHLHPVSVPRQTTLVQAGEPARALGLLLQGTATVLAVDPATGESTARELLRSGDHFGEIGALLHAVQPFSVITDEQSVALFIAVEIIDTLAERVPAFAHALARCLSSRMAQTSLSSLPPRSAVASGAPRAATSRLPDPDVIPFGRVADYTPTPDVIAMVPSNLVLQYQIVPLELRGKVLTVGMVNPYNTAALQELQRLLYTVTPSVVAIGLDDFMQTMARFRIGASPTASRSR